MEARVSQVWRGTRRRRRRGRWRLGRRRHARLARWLSTEQLGGAGDEDKRGRAAGPACWASPRQQVSLFSIFCLFNLSFLYFLFCNLFAQLNKIARHFYKSSKFIFGLT